MEDCLIQDNKVNPDQAIGFLVSDKDKLSGNTCTGNTPKCSCPGAKGQPDCKWGAYPVQDAKAATASTDAYVN